MRLEKHGGIGMLSDNITTTKNLTYDHVAWVTAHCMINY